MRLFLQYCPSTNRIVVSHVDGDGSSRVIATCRPHELYVKGGEVEALAREAVHAPGSQIPVPQSSRFVRKRNWRFQARH